MSKPREYLTGYQWADWFRRVLGIERRTALTMLRHAIEQGLFEERRNGVWGVTYKMRDER